MCLLFYVMRDSTRFYIGGTYETGDDQRSIQSLLISEDIYDKEKIQWKYLCIQLAVRLKKVRQQN